MLDPEYLQCTRSLGKESTMVVKGPNLSQGVKTAKRLSHHTSVSGLPKTFYQGIHAEYDFSLDTL